MFALNLRAFENKKYTAYDRFHGNGPFDQERTNQNARIYLMTTLPYNKVNYFRKRLLPSWSNKGKEHLFSSGLHPIPFLSDITELQ
jgi:hypothetical protein